MRWTRAKTNFVLDCVIALAGLGEAISGFILWLVLPSGGYQGGRGVDALRVFIFEREAWKGLHSWLAITMTAAVILHVALHWNWIVCMARKMWKDAFPARQELVAVEQERQL